MFTPIADRPKLEQRFAACGLWSGISPPPTHHFHSVLQNMQTGPCNMGVRRIGDDDGDVMVMMMVMVMVMMVMVMVMADGDGDGDDGDGAEWC